MRFWNYHVLLAHEKCTACPTYQVWHKKRTSKTGQISGSRTNHYVLEKLKAADTSAPVRTVVVQTVRDATYDRSSNTPKTFSASVAGTYWIVPRVCIDVHSPTKGAGFAGRDGFRSHHNPTPSIAM
jgi:hypothetical protein